MYKVVIHLIFLLLFCFASLNSSAVCKKDDSITTRLQSKLKEFEKTDVDSSYYYAHQLIKHFHFIGNDSLLIRSYQDLGRVFKFNKQLDSSFYYYNAALKVTSINNYPSLIARTHLLLGVNHASKSEYSKATEHYKKALHVSQKHNSAKYEAISHAQISDIHWDQGDFQNALKALLTSMEVVEQHKLEDLRLTTLLNIASLYIVDKQWETALIKLNEVLTLAKEKNDIYSQTVAYNNIGAAYEALKNFDKALIYYSKSLELRKSGNITNGLSTNFHNLGSLNYQLGKYKQAIYFLNKSLDLKLNKKTSLLHIDNYEYLSKVYIKTKRFKKAAHFLSKAKAMAEELNLIEKKVELAKVETEYYFEIRELSLAQKAFTKYDSLRKLFSENEKSEKIIQMQTLYETEKKEKENALLKAKNKLAQHNLEEEIQSKNKYFISFGISIVILIIIIALLRRMSGAHKTIKDFNIKLKDSNEKLQLINSTKDKFFSIIAHDLRSPLGAILSFSNLIDDECTSNKEVDTVKEYNTYLNQSARNLNSLLENLLQWSKSQLGSIKHHASNFILSKVIEENIEIQKLKAREKSIDIKYQADESVSIFADINMVNTIIRNLLSNAIKFSYPKSEITIFAETEGNMLKLSVQDRGIGISDSKQNKLFKIDSNLSTLGTNNETGTGLGLILCKEFAETNGGAIWITSEEGKGSTFTFTIPLKDA